MPNFSFPAKWFYFSHATTLTYDTKLPSHGQNLLTSLVEKKCKRNDLYEMKI